MQQLVLAVRYSAQYHLQYVLYKIASNQSAMHPEKQQHARPMVLPIRTAVARPSSVGTIAKSACKY
jgi:hypothetical protein